MVQNTLKGKARFSVHFSEGHIIFPFVHNFWTLHVIKGILSCVVLTTNLLNNMVIYKANTVVAISFHFKCLYDSIIFVTFRKISNVIAIF